MAKTFDQSLQEAIEAARVSCRQLFKVRSITLEEFERRGRRWRITLGFRSKETMGLPKLKVFVLDSRNQVKAVENWSGK